MTRVSRLLREYERHISVPWQPGLSGVQRIIFVVHDKSAELHLRTRIEEFEIATKKAGHGWVLHDLTNSFPRWMISMDYRETYFEYPEDIEGMLPQFVEHVVDEIKSILAGPNVQEDTVVAIMGIACLFGFARVSEIMPKVAPHVPGRLVVFFPGEYESQNNNYHLLDARDGWNYLAVPITIPIEG